MVPVYDRNNIRVDFISKPFTKIEEKYITKTIIYPVLRYKIMAPVVEDIALNVFQKGVLSLLNKGNFDIQKIADWLKLDKQLVKIILAELNSKGFLDQNHITKTGREIIENTFSWFNNAAHFRKDIYYIYQDIFTTNLYPLMSRIDPENNFWIYENGKININNREIFATLISAQDTHKMHIFKPEIHEIFDVMKNCAGENHEGDSDGAPGTIIHYLDDAPKLSYILTTLFIKRNGTGVDDIKVLNPFDDKKEAYWLQENLVSASKKHNKLKEIIDDMVRHTHASIDEQLAEALREIYNKSTERANVFFEDHKTRYEELYGAMRDLYQDLFLYEHHHKGKYLKESLKNAQTVLETLFEYIYKEHNSGYEKLMGLGRKIDNIDSDIIGRKALSINEKIEIPPRGFKNIRGVRDVLRQRNSSLRPKYIAAILAAEYDAKNPMNELLKNKTDLLVFLEKLATRRNKVGHNYLEISDNTIGDFYDEIKEMHHGVEETVKIFLGGKQHGTK